MGWAQKIPGAGGGHNDKFAHLLRYSNHAFYDFRRNQHGDTGTDAAFLAGFPNNAVSWGDGGIKNYAGDSTRLAATAGAGARLALATNVADAVSELFVIARVKFRAGETAETICRGRDGSGDGWSIRTPFGATGATFYAVTTSGGAALRTAEDLRVYQPERWYTYFGAYKSGSYVKVGVDGVWTATSAFANTGLRASTLGMGINRANSFDATSNYNIRFLGVGTTIPSDGDLMVLHHEILENEQEEYLRYGGLLSSVGGGGGSSFLAWF